MRGIGTQANTTRRRHARTALSLRDHRMLVAAALAVAASGLMPGAARAQVSPQMLQTANACLAGEPSACDSIHGRARAACLFGSRFACLIAEEVRTIRARIGSGGGGAVRHATAAGTDGADAYRAIRTYCSDPRMAPHLQALNLCG
jgi:hypothetical protein